MKFLRRTCKSVLNFPYKKHALHLALLISLLSLACGTVNVQSGSYPPFIKAAQSGDIAEAEKLLKSGELVNQTSIGNQTALHIAAAEGQDAMVRWLLAHEANPTAQDQNGKTPADFAKSQGHNQTAQIILDFVQLVTDEDTALSNGDIEALRSLLLQDERDLTVLHIVTQAGDIQRVADEIENSADIDAQTAVGLTPLHKAVAFENVQICQLLLDSGANVNAVDVYNNTPLYYAILKGNKDLVRLFMDANADPDIRSVFGDESALDYARRKGDPDIIALIEDR